MAEDRTARMTPEERRVIFASSLGTVFEWYDFYLYGSLAAIISVQFFSGVNPTAGFIFALLAFAAGFAVRPFGAIVFGRLGDLVGRKYTFLVTILIMGVATFIVGLLPNYETIGFAAPAILIALRLAQGLALGGEYGGAAIYVAEHAPHAKRGAYTSWIQTTATLGLFLSLLVILGCRLSMDKESFESWGWRIPFLLSIVLLGISVWIRLRLNESPLFQRMKAEGTLSKAPLTESFARWGNLKIVIIALVGLTAGQAVVWYTGQFYALFFLTQVLKVDSQTANILIGGALLVGVPFFVIFGALSDRIGRKPIILAGCLLAALTYFPLFSALTHYANPALEAAQERAPVVVVADSAACSFQFNPVGTSAFTTPCDVAKSELAKRGIPYSNAELRAGEETRIEVGSIAVPSFDASDDAGGEARAAFAAALTLALTEAGYPLAADLAAINYPMVVLILFILVLYVTMVYGPIAAMLVELFPTRIRYTSMSLPYHIGNGWFGGFLPTVSFAIVAATGNLYSGLWYPVAIAAMTFVVGLIFVPETKDRALHPEEG
ncbi:General substrate transporter [Parvibaculum lavamentivorans DS-1]|uniref:General substrate transporter n=1 Tax=Parvibaculum lavamentivorans (strain DS-1 / DSM 13023 / NCIMB 13966) TaxID=402881 RepID=A7HSZ8_PARL1|nr:MFS transporter [Parvibaculum lavamentivorans]ABS63031.1 General substrate transporter [Parvibaculum lavamentivorans DS-1]